MLQKSSEIFQKREYFPIKVMEFYDIEIKIRNFVKDLIVN